MNFWKSLYFSLACSISLAFANPVAEGLEPASLVYKAGEEGYPFYRIPSLTVTDKGTILTFAEGRYYADDHAQNDIVLKRSTDGGKTWGKLQVIHGDKDLVMVNPSAVTLSSGRILVFYETFPWGYHARKGGHKHKSYKMMPTGFGANTQKFLVRASDDDGKTWSKALELQKKTRLEKNIISSGSPANAIQLQKGAHKGRIIAPLFLTERIDDKNRTWRNAVLYSDDEGKSWKRSAFVPVTTTQAPNECLVSETDEGHVVLNGRAGRDPRRAISVSTDGGATWPAYAYTEELKNRPCNCGLLKFGYGENNRTYFSFNNSTKRRKNGFVAISKDDGKTWPMRKQVVPGFFGYSQLVKCDENTLGMIYEPFESPREKWDIYFVRIPTKWLEQENQKPNTKKVTDADFIGLTEKAAGTLAKTHKLISRVVSRDGQSLPVTMDMNPERLNFHIVKGLVTKVTRG